MTYNIFNDNGDSVAVDMTAQGVCDIYCLDVHDLLWAIEEYGECGVLTDTGHEMTIIEYGEGGE